MRSNWLVPMAMAALLSFGGAACQGDQAEEPMETETMEESEMEMEDESMDGEMEETEEPMDDET